MNNSKSNKRSRQQKALERLEANYSKAIREYELAKQEKNKEKRFSENWFDSAELAIKRMKREIETLKSRV